MDLINLQGNVIVTKGSTMQALILRVDMIVRVLTEIMFLYKNVSIIV